jgi:hypothetical protein
MIRLDQVCVCKHPTRKMIQLGHLTIPICRTCGAICLKVKNTVSA